jgi:hypothetical protein
MCHLPLMIRMIGVMSADENFTGLANLSHIDQHPELALLLAPMVIAMQRAGWNENLKAIASGLVRFPELARQAQRILEMPEPTARANVAEKPPSYKIKRGASSRLHSRANSSARL